MILLEQQWCCIQKHKQQCMRGARKVSVTAAVVWVAKLCQESLPCLLSP